MNNLENNLKVGKLSIALYPTKFASQDGNVTYHAKVVNRDTATMDDICDDLVASGNNYGLTADELKGVWQNICKARMNRLAEGISSEDDIGTMYPSVKGTFVNDQSSFIQGTHSITVQLRPSEKTAVTMAGLTPVITQGNTRHPVIDGVRDLRSQSDTVLTPGGLLSVKGCNICLAGDDESVGLYFENVLDPEEVVKVSEEDVSTNSRNALCCIIPAGLKAGCRYRLRLVTQFNGSKKVFRKEPQMTYAAAEFHVPAALSE